LSQPLEQSPATIMAGIQPLPEGIADQARAAAVGAAAGYTPVYMNQLTRCMPHAI
jgi:hypothetical protein